MFFLAALGWSVLLVDPGEPVSFDFLRGCGPMPGHTRAYDPDKHEYFLDVHGIARFEVRSVASDLSSRPLIFRIEGMLDDPEGPLELQVGGRKYPMGTRDFDRKLFQVERKDGITTISFRAAARKLLKPGAAFQYIDFYRG